MRKRRIKWRIQQKTIYHPRPKHVPAKAAGRFHKFSKKSKKIQKIAFCNFGTLTHLTPYTPKTYINISPQNTHLLINSSAHILIHPSTFLCKTKPISIDLFTHLPRNLSRARRESKKSQKIPKIAFYNFGTLTHLTLCTTKTYINISPQNTHLFIYSFTHLPIHFFIQNEPNLPTLTYLKEIVTSLKA